MNNTTYSAGTVSVPASGVTVTGSGTAWATYGVRAGDMLLLGGQLALIAAVNSNTSITLKRPWSGAAQSGAAYDILLLDDEVRALIAANSLLQALSGGTLTSLGQIAGAANQMPYWTGMGIMNSTDLTSQARSLLGSGLLSVNGNNLVTGSSARVTGGAVTQNSDDTTAGRLLKVSDFGLGGLAVSVPNLNDIRVSGIYTINVTNATSSGSAPTNSIYGVYHNQNGSEFGSQIAFRVATSLPSPEVYSRTWTLSGGWTSWTRLLVASELTSGSADTTAGKILTVGYMGLGSFSPGLPAVNDFNEARTGGAYTIGTTMTNGPDGPDAITYSGQLLVWKRQYDAGASVAQLFFARGSGNNLAYMRVGTSSSHVFTPWRRMITDQNVLGNCQQPSSLGHLGAIIERGSNANGEFTRWADGTQICWRATAIGTDPAAFVGTPVPIDGGKMKIGRWY